MAKSLAVWLKNAYSCPKIGVISTPKWGAISKNPKGTSAGRNGSRGVLIMSVSSIVPEKLRGNKKCDEGRRTTHFCPFWHRCVA